MKIWFGKRTPTYDLKVKGLQNGLQTGLQCLTKQVTQTLWIPTGLHFPGPLKGPPASPVFKIQRRRRCYGIGACRISAVVKHLVFEQIGLFATGTRLKFIDYRSQNPKIIKNQMVQSPACPWKTVAPSSIVSALSEFLNQKHFGKFSGRFGPTQGPCLFGWAAACQELRHSLALWSVNSRIVPMKFRLSTSPKQNAECDNGFHILKNGDSKHCKLNSPIAQHKKCCFHCKPAFHPTLLSIINHTCPRLSGKGFAKFLAEWKSRWAPIKEPFQIVHFPVSPAMWLRRTSLNNPIGKRENWKKTMLPTTGILSQSRLHASISGSLRAPHSSSARTATVRAELRRVLAALLSFARRRPGREQASKGWVFFWKGISWGRVFDGFYCRMATNSLKGFSFWEHLKVPKGVVLDWNSSLVGSHGVGFPNMGCKESGWKKLGWISGATENDQTCSRKPLEQPSQK